MDKKGLKIQQGKVKVPKMKRGGVMKARGGTFKGTY
jgi:hypothetical protein